MTEAVGFKEWQVVCDALASGRQTIILRKGGIREGRTGFSFAHSSFFLFPTRFHAQLDQVTEGDVPLQPEWENGEAVKITHFAQAMWAKTLNRWDQVEALAPYHIYAPSLVRERFEWEARGIPAGSIHVALVRISKLSQPWVLPYQSKFAGCRSWITLPPLEESAISSSQVIQDAFFEQIRAEIESKAGLLS